MEHTPEDRLLLRRIGELVSRSERDFCVLYTNFLTPAQQMLILSDRENSRFCSFVGGWEEAERRLCRVCTDKYAVDDGAPIVMLRAEATAPDAVISHRDVLGSLMGLGIKREMIGDICAGSRQADFFCLEKSALHIEMNLTKIGRYSVSLRRADCSEMPPPETVSSTVNVSSMRLDSLCAEGFGISRTKAAEFIRSGAVCVNWILCDDVSREISPGDRLSLRGKGKLRVGEVTGTSRKGRTFVEIVRYV